MTVDGFDEKYYIIKYFNIDLGDALKQHKKSQMTTQMNDALEIEHQERDMSKEDRLQLLQIMIDDALENGDKTLFLNLTEEYNSLKQQE